MASSSRASGKGSKSPESFDSLTQRNAAAEILQSYEKLSWYSFQRCESLAQTRLHFQNMVAGFTQEDEAALVDWRTDNTPRLKPGEEARVSRKGKERVSFGGGGGDAVAGSSSSKAAKGREGGSGSGKKKRKSGGSGT